MAVVYWFVVSAVIGLGVKASAQELALRETLPARGFSFQVPEGFDVTKNTAKGSISATRPSDNVTFEAREVEFDGELSVLAKAASDAMKEALDDYKLLEQKKYSLKSGIRGLKLYLQMRPSKDGPLVRQVLYFFDGRSGHKGFVTCGALSKEGAKFDSLWDRVVNSVVINE